MGRVQENFLSLGWEIILEGDEPKVGQWHEEEGRKQEYNHIIIFPEMLHQERSGQVNTTVMEHFNSILFLKSGPSNKQHTCQSITRDEELRV